MLYFFPDKSEEKKHYTVFETQWKIYLYHVSFFNWKVLRTLGRS